MKDFCKILLLGIILMQVGIGDVMAQNQTSSEKRRVTGVVKDENGVFVEPQ